MDVLTTISLNNWNNQLDLYDDIQQKTNKIVRKETPILSYYSDEFGWPNFSIVSEIGSDVNEFVRIIDQSIVKHEISPFILTEPVLHENSSLTQAFENHGIRQIDQWPSIYYDLTKGLPERPGVPDLLIETVKDELALDVWHQVARRVLFSGNKLPVSGFMTPEYVLLTGYFNGTPAACTLVFIGSDTPSVHMVAVLPEYRKKGIGQQIFIEALELSAKMGATRVFAQASQMGKKPWLDIGFESSGYINVFWKVGLV